MLKSLYKSSVPDAAGGDPLTAGYARLLGVDLALREAEKTLQSAHIAFAGGNGPCPDGAYREVVRLRQQSRRVLDELGNLLLGKIPAAI